MRVTIRFAPAAGHGGVEGSVPACEGDVVGLGRGTDNAARIVFLLNSYDDVSRAHATMRILRHKIEIVDTSRYGTWLGTERLPANEPRVFALPTELLLAQQCRVHVEVAP